MAFSWGRILELNIMRVELMISYLILPLTRRRNKMRIILLDLFERDWTETFKLPLRSNSDVSAAANNIQIITIPIPGTLSYNSSSYLLRATQFIFSRKLT